MPFDVLDWSITPIVQTTSVVDPHGNSSPGHEVLYLEVKPIVNGITVETPWMFDTVALLVRQSPDYYTFDMFTCDCGVAGCAGIHDYVHMRVGEDTVQWQFPRVAPFIDKLVPLYFNSTEHAMVWTFSAAQYRASMATLVERLKRHEASQTLPVQLWPAGERFSDTDEHEPLSTQMERWKKNMAQNMEHQNNTAAYWGVLYEAEATIAVPSGTRVYSVGMLLSHAANIVVGIDPEKDDESIEEEQEEMQEKYLDESVCYYREHPQKLVELIKNFSWDQLQDKHFMSTGEDNDVQNTIASQWPYVDITLQLHVPLNQRDWSKL